MILCCGEALIDMIPEDTVSGGKGFVPHAGGAVFNTALALGRLGAQSGMYTGLSSDPFGALLKDKLEESHVDTSRVTISDRLTTLAVVHLKDGHATYRFYDENSAGRMIAPDDLPELGADVSALYFGGISLCSLPAADTYRTLAERGAKGRVVMIDPNIRPSFVDDEAAYRARIKAMLALSDIVKISDEDLAWIEGGSDDLDAAAGSLLGGKTKIVILTLGSKGAKAFWAGGSVEVGAQKVTVVDTVGAGDSFNAGVLASLSKAGLLTEAALGAISKDELRAALEMGARVAAVTVSRAGADVPWAHEI